MKSSPFNTLTRSFCKTDCIFKNDKTQGLKCQKNLTSYRVVMIKTTFRLQNNFKAKKGPKFFKSRLMCSTI